MFFRSSLVFFRFNWSSERVIISINVVINLSNYALRLYLSTEWVVSSTFLILLIFLPPIPFPLCMLSSCDLLYFVLIPRLNLALGPYL